MSAAQDRLALRREEILEAAERAFASRGYHATGIADIAADLGIGHGTFYRYFKNKQDIADSVAERVLERITAIGLSEDPTASATAAEYRAQTERILGGMVAFAESQPLVLQLFHEQLVTIAPDRLGTLLDNYAALTELFLKNGVDRGFLRADIDIEPTSQALVALIFEGTRRALSGSAEESRRFISAGIDLMFKGVAA